MRFWSRLRLKHGRRFRARRSEKHVWRFEKRFSYGVFKNAYRVRLSRLQKCDEASARAHSGPPCAGAAPPARSTFLKVRKSQLRLLRAPRARTRFIKRSYFKLKTRPLRRETGSRSICRAVARVVARDRSKNAFPMGEPATAQGNTSSSLARRPNEKLA